MSDYIQDSNDSNKQVPGARPDNYYTRYGIPATNTFVKSPHYVIVNTALNDEFGFFFGSKTQFDAKDAADRVNVKYPAAFGTVGTRLDINPTAISSSVRDAGSITFEYRGGLDGQGRK
jgi:hypothetical protein